MGPGRALAPLAKLTDFGLCRFGTEATGDWSLDKWIQDGTRGVRGNPAWGSHPFFMIFVNTNGGKLNAFFRVGKNSKVQSFQSFIWDHLGDFWMVFW